MMTLSKFFLTASMAALVTLGTASSEAQAQGHRRPGPGTQRHGRVSALAHRLEQQAREVLREFRIHFGRSPRFRYLERDVLEMARMADHIHDVAHRGGSLSHLRRDVRDLDRLFHRVEAQVEDLFVSCRVDRQGVAHIRADLARMGQTLHQLQRELN